MDILYEPQEDSHLLKGAVLSYLAAHRVRRMLDLCTGKGIIAAACEGKVPEILGVDINPQAVAFCREAYPALRFLVSDLFSSVEGRFDLITCNPPYLPDETGDPDIALDGGPTGHELIVRILEGARQHLASGGALLLLYSTRSGPEAIDEAAKGLGYTKEKLSEQSFFFETLSVYAFRPGKSKD